MESDNTEMEKKRFRKTEEDKLKTINNKNTIDEREEKEIEKKAVNKACDMEYNREGTWGNIKE